MGKDVHTAEVALFLRWPWRHKKYARQYFGNVEDRTLERLQELHSFDYYDGPLGLRQMVTVAVRAPVVGWAIGTILANFVMIDTVSRKSA